MRPSADSVLAAGLALAAACRTAPPVAKAATSTVEVQAGIDPSILDRSVRPCDDFYRFACGGWIAGFSLPPDKSSFSRSFTSIDDRNLIALREIASADAAGQLDPADRYPAKVGDFWAACMDEAAIEQHGAGRPAGRLEADRRGQGPGLAGRPGSEISTARASRPSSTWAASRTRRTPPR